MINSLFEDKLVFFALLSFVHRKKFFSFPVHTTYHYYIYYISQANVFGNDCVNWI
jgi:hypothetical protein